MNNQTYRNAIINELIDEMDETLQQTFNPDYQGEDLIIIDEDFDEDQVDLIRNFVLSYRE